MLLLPQQHRRRAATAFGALALLLGTGALHELLSSSTPLHSSRDGARQRAQAYQHDGHRAAEDVAAGKAIAAAVVGFDADAWASTALDGPLWRRHCDAIVVLAGGVDPGGLPHATVLRRLAAAAALFYAIGKLTRRRP